MNSENINRLKKYLFLISMFFSLLIWGHILYIYLYDGAIETPIEWWSVSEWIIWDFPHLNPLINSNDYNKNIIYMLYRSLLKYDFENKKIVWDLANCDIKNLHNIKCYLEDWAKWSNWKDITTDDVISTYNIIKNSDINPLIGSLIKETSIEWGSWIIIFKNKISDINFLQALFQPIVSKEVLDNIWNKELFWKFNPIDWVFSGPYKVDTVSYDDSLGIQKLILTKNQEYKKENILISKYIYKIFRDTEHFLKHKDTINVFLDKNNIVWDTVSRLDKVSFYLNKYMSIFINEEKIKNPDLRSFILSKIDNKNIIKSLWTSYTEANNAYLLEWIKSRFESQNLNLENTIREMWYYKKDFLISSLKENKKNDEKTSSWKINSDLKYIVSPINKKYNFLNEDNILISWTTLWENVEEVYINDYKLSSFKPWNKEFFYRIKREFKNINIWENNYKLYFSNWWKKELKEEFYIIFSKDKEKLKSIQDNYFKTQTNETKPQTTLNEEKKQKIAKLDDKYYYDYNLNKFTLKLYYVEDNPELVWVANIIKNSLETYWIIINTIPISLSDLNKKITAWEKDYDMILVWLDLGIFDFNIFPYFHSSQSKAWFSFSNIKNLNLDILLEDLKNNLLSEEERLDKMKKVIEIINDRKIFKPIYRKENIVLIDKNIKNFKLNKNIASSLAINDALNKSYITSQKEIDLKTKSLSNFLDFILKVFKNEW